MYTQYAISVAYTYTSHAFWPGVSIAETAKSTSLVLRFAGGLCLIRRSLEETPKPSAERDYMIGDVALIDIRGGAQRMCTRMRGWVAYDLPAVYTTHQPRAG